jgi:transcriptional regulator with XRE-family HTH domain
MPNDVDSLVGRRIRERRHILGVTQQKLAAATATSFQQLQKYETGKNRVSASRLYAIAQVLKAPVEHFFSGLDQPEKVFVDREAAEMQRLFMALPDKVRGTALAFLKSLLPEQPQTPPKIHTYDLRSEMMREESERGA